MIVRRIHLFENGVTLGCLPEALLLQVAGKNVSNILELLGCRDRHRERGLPPRLGKTGFGGVLNSIPKRLPVLRIVVPRIRNESPRTVDAAGASVTRTISEPHMPNFTKIDRDRS